MLQTIYSVPPGRDARAELWEGTEELQAEDPMAEIYKIQTRSPCSNGMRLHHDLEKDQLTPPGLRVPSYELGQMTTT